MSRLIDLTGQTFGYLTVIKRVENKKDKTCWLCQCKCGNQVVVYGTNLRRGLTKSCGCFRKEKLKELRLEDLVGKKFGKLTVIKLHHYEPQTRQYYWECKCECGGTAIVYSGHLKSGHTKSCGCITSKGEEKIAKLLIDNNIPFKKQYSFKDCVGINGGRLKFDFAIFNENGLSYLIEYDGIQHEKKSNSGWDENNRFEERQFNDKVKDNFCKDNNITLIRINYRQYDTLNIDDLLLNNVQK